MTPRLHTPVAPLALTAAVLACCGANAEKTVLDIDWHEAAQQAADPAVTWRDGALEIVNDAGRPLALELLRLERPAITSGRYAIVGEVACEGVEGRGYLEMLSLFDREYFSKTLDSSGPARALEGTAAARPFALVFSARDGVAPGPARLRLLVHLPGPGTVRLGPARLVELGPLDTPAAVAEGHWWSGPMGGVIGGAAGTVVGVLGAVVGVLTSRGRGRGAVMAMLLVMAAAGAIALAAGLLALARAQPYAVYYPLLLGGGLCLVLSLPIRASARRRFEALELRQMRAMDAGITGDPT